MERIWLRWWGCGAFDVRFGDVNIAFDPYLFGENLDNAQPIYDYIFISHEHFDHCHPKTLRKLCQGERFKRLFVPPGALWPDEPIDEKYGDAAFSRDLPITKHVAAEKIQVMYPQHQNEHAARQTLGGHSATCGSFPVRTEVDLGALHVETIESGENQRPDLPNLGFLVTHKRHECLVLAHWRRVGGLSRYAGVARAGGLCHSHETRAVADERGTPIDRTRGLCGLHTAACLDPRALPHRPHFGSGAGGALAAERQRCRCVHRVLSARKSARRPRCSRLRRVSSMRSSCRRSRWSGSGNG